MKKNKKVKGKKINTSNGKTLIVAVDLGKVKNTGYYRCPNGTDIKPFEFHNNRQGFNKFWWRICQGMKLHSLEDIVVGFESTGPYGEPLTHYLQKKDVKLVLVNPMHTKRLKELQGNSPQKTDQKDPKVIADIIELGHALSIVVPEGSGAELRRLTHAREREIQRRTSLFNQLHDLVFVLFPEFLQIMKKLTTKSAQYLLEHYPTPHNIAECGLEGLNSILKKISRGKLGIGRAKALYDSSQVSVGVNEGEDGIVIEIRHILDLIKASDHYIAAIEKKMHEHLKLIPYSRSILSIKGIGEIIAAGLIGEVGDFREFKSIGEITKIAGLDLFEISSGNHKGIRRISKRGRSLMRKILFFAAIGVVRKGGILHKTYQKYLNRGQLKMKALIAIARKLLRIIFALVHNNTEYIYNYD
jgi:transposase